MSALLQLGLSLKQYENDIVLAGGWAPYFITRDYFSHCGSVDIDIVLRTEIVPKYDTIRDIIEGLGYHPVAYRPFQFTRKIRSRAEGLECNIRLDLMCEKEGLTLTDIAGYHDVQKDLSACVFDGLGIAFDFNFWQEIETYLPDNGVTKSKIRIIDLVGSLALKGKALAERYNPKDAYDIFALTHYRGGPLAAAEYFNQAISGKGLSKSKQKLLDESLEIIAYEFKDRNQRGPFDVESFSEQKYSKDAVAAQVNQFLSKIGYNRS